MVELGQVGGDIVSKLLSGTVMVGIALIVIFVLGILMYYFGYYKKKFDIKVLIKSERADDKFRIIEDKAAILYDKKDKASFLRVLGAKVDLPVPPYWVIQRTNKGDLIELYRKGEDEFIYLAPGTINKTWILRSNKMAYPMAQIEQKQLDGDVSYWHIKRKDKHRKLFDTESLIMKLLPYLPHIIGGVMTIFVLYVLFDSLPGLIGQLAELARELRSLKGADVVTGGVLWLTLKQR